MSAASSSPLPTVESIWSHAPLSSPEGMIPGQNTIHEIGITHGVDGIWDEVSGGSTLSSPEGMIPSQNSIVYPFANWEEWEDFSHIFRNFDSNYQWSMPQTTIAEGDSSSASILHNPTPRYPDTFNSNYQRPILQTTIAEGDSSSASILHHPTPRYLNAFNSAYQWPMPQTTIAHALGADGGCGSASRKSDRRRAPKRKRSRTTKVRASTRRMDPQILRRGTIYFSQKRAFSGKQIEMPPSMCTTPAELRLRKPCRVEKRGRPGWACGLFGCLQVSGGEAVSRRHMLTHFNLQVACFGCEHSFGTNVNWLRKHVEHASQYDKMRPCVEKNPSLWQPNQESGKSHSTSTEAWEEVRFLESATLIQEGPSFHGGVRLVRLKWV